MGMLSQYLEADLVTYLNRIPKITNKLSQFSYLFYGDTWRIVDL